MTHSASRQIAERQIIAAAVLAALFVFAWLAAVLPISPLQAEIGDLVTPRQVAAASTAPAIARVVTSAN